MAGAFIKEFFRILYSHHNICMCNYKTFRKKDLCRFVINEKSHRSFIVKYKIKKTQETKGNRKKGDKLIGMKTFV